MIDERRRKTIAICKSCEVKVFVEGSFKGVVHIIQSGDCVAVDASDGGERIQELINALQKAKEFVNEMEAM
ncbi:hypothetical protein Roomu2_00154 [Pseudomonas phage vB_PpuM-Roomu-2]|uniref:Uncharacterized protein n=1 Tax=Pseudomonas phage vB_PpuM-Roomu-2 TaxID=3132621 RepID=A0AAX4N0W6_9CAUD